GPDAEHDDELAEEERPRFPDAPLDREQDDGREDGQRLESHRHAEPDHHSPHRRNSLAPGAASFHPSGMTWARRPWSKLTVDALAEAIRTGGRAGLRRAAVRLEALGGRGRCRRSPSAQPLPAQLLAR